MIRSLAGGQLLGQVVGNGVPKVLALHGWGRTHGDFDAVFDDGEVLDAVCLDLPGFGVAPPPDGVWGTSDYAERVAEVFGEMDTPIVLLGHSFGGLVAIQLAVARPDLVGALVLTGVPRLGALSASARSPLRFRAARRLNKFGLLGEKRMESLRQRYGSADYRAAEGIMRKILVRVLSERYEEQLGAIQCPVSLVWGSDDTAAPLAGAEEVSRRLQRADLTVCEGAGHLTPLSVPEILRRVVQENLVAISQ